MGYIKICSDTPKNPISMIGEYAGVCWGADTISQEKNYKRGLNCLNADHGRTLEFPQVYMILDEYSARVIREYYTHIGGDPTRLQESTRYVDYSNFDYVVPPTILRKNGTTEALYRDTMKHIANACKALIEAGVPKEDAAMLLPLGMETKVVVRTNLRQLIDMSHQRLCTRAYWEFRQLMYDLMNELSYYSDEWAYLIENYFKPKCESYGFCTELKSCGRKPQLEK